MRCHEFQAICERSAHLTPEAYGAWVLHMNECSACGEWYMAREVERWGGEVSSYPCVHVAYYATLRCRTHRDALSCPDCLVVREPAGTFAIPVHDGNRTAATIRFCPWCGIELKPNPSV
jgi:hypothetical protein